MLVIFKGEHLLDWRHRFTWLFILFLLKNLGFWGRFICSLSHHCIVLH